MADLSTGTKQLMGLLLTDRPYTQAEQDAISRFVDASKAQRTALRNQLAANPPGYNLRPYKDRRFKAGSGDVETTVYAVVLSGQSSRIGDLTQHGERWRGQAVNDPQPGPGRATQHEAVLDVMISFAITGGS